MGEMNAVKPTQWRQAKKLSDFTMSFRENPRMTEPSTPLLSPKTAITLSDAPKTATAWLHTARFLTTAPQLEYLPRINEPEIAFVGRSNAGKSTAINTLTQQKRLAFASKTPGRTQSINLFAVGKQGSTDAVLADLPGYGYAAVPKEAKLRWQRVMASYLRTRRNLNAVVMLADARLGLTELDDILLEVIRPRVEEGLKLLVLLTKADKLTRAEAQKALSIARLQIGGGQAMLFSALKRQGVEEASVLLRQWATAAAFQQEPSDDSAADDDNTPNQPAGDSTPNR